MDEAPAFDPSKPFEAAADAPPAFDPSKPFEEAKPNAVVEGVKDVAKSAGIGAVEGGIGLSTMGADVRNLALKGAEYLGVPKEVTGTINRIGSKMAPILGGGPTSEEVKKKIEGVTGEFYKPQTTAGGYAHSIGQMAPGAVAGPGGLLRRVATMAVLPGVASEAAGTIKGIKDTEYEPWVRAAAAIASPAIVERFITPTPTRMNRNDAVRFLRNEGVELSGGQASGHERLRYAESELGGSTARHLVDRQQQQYTMAALRRAGEHEAPLATPEVMDRNFSRIGDEFDRIARAHLLVPDPHMFNDIGGAVRRYNRLVPANSRADAVQSWVDDIVTELMNNRGHLPGDVYGAMRSRLGTEARSAGGDQHLQRALYEIQGALDNNMARILSGSGSQDLARLQEARRQYRNMIVLERAAGYAGEAAAAGIITPQNLARATRSLHGMRNYVRGQGDFAPLARAGSEVMGALPNSGTSARWWIHGISAGLGAALGAPTGGLGTAGGIVAGAALPRLIGEAALSNLGRRYLGNARIPRDQNPYASGLLRGMMGRGEQ